MYLKRTSWKGEPSGFIFTLPQSQLLIGSPLYFNSRAGEKLVSANFRMLSKYFPFKPVFNITGNTKFKYCVGDTCDMMRTFSSVAKFVNKILYLQNSSRNQFNNNSAMNIFIFCLVQFRWSLISIEYRKVFPSFSCLHYFS